MGIRDLTQTTTLGTADQFPVWSSGGGDDQRVAAATLLAFMQANLTFNASRPPQQFAVPTSGQTVTVTQADSWLIMTPAGTLAALTVALPAVKADGQIVLITTTQSLTALTISGAGSAVQLAPATLAPGTVEMRFSAALNAWFRTG